MALIRIRTAARCPTKVSMRRLYEPKDGYTEVRQEPCCVWCWRMAANLPFPLRGSLGCGMRRPTSVVGGN